MASDKGATTPDTVPQEIPEENPPEKTQETSQQISLETPSESSQETQQVKEQSKQEETTQPSEVTPQVAEETKKAEELPQQSSKKTSRLRNRSDEKKRRQLEKFYATETRQVSDENLQAEGLQRSVEEPQQVQEAPQQVPEETFKDPSQEILQASEKTQPTTKKSSRLRNWLSKIRFRKLPEDTQKAKEETVQVIDVNQLVVEVPQQSAEVPQQVTEEPPKETTSQETIQQQIAEANAIESIENIDKYANDLKSLLPKRALMCIGEYPIHLLLKGRFVGKLNGVLPLFIDKSSVDIAKWSPTPLDKKHIIGLDADLDTHFWFNIIPTAAIIESLTSRFKNTPIEKMQDAVIVSSVWDGVGSALLPTLISQLNEWKVSSVTLTLFPSKIQPLENQFNAFAALGTCLTKDPATLVLIDRDNLESYIGVDRDGNMINGNEIANYLLGIILSKDTFVQELNELAKTFNSKLYTLLLASGASLKIYGSIGNILDTTLFKPFLTFDLSSATLLYVLVRVPYHLKEKLSRAKLEMAVASWFKDKATLKSIHVTEPIYAEDTTDRVDIVLFIGGFDTTKMFSAQEKKIKAMKDQAVKNGFIKEEDWVNIVKNLTE
jgi:hypothetical protein